MRVERKGNGREHIQIPSEPTYIHTYVCTYISTFVCKTLAIYTPVQVRATHHSRRVNVCVNATDVYTKRTNCMKTLTE